MHFVPGTGTGPQVDSLPRWGSRLGIRQGANGLSLRTKALLAFGALVLYLAGVAVMVEQQRHRLRDVVAELTAARKVDETLVQAHMAAVHAMVAVHDAALTPMREQAVPGLLLDTADVAARLQPLALGFPDTQALRAGIDQATARLRLEATVANLASLRTALYEAASVLSDLRSRMHLREAGLLSSYERIYDSITWMSMVLGMLGIAVFGALVTLFFARLASDIQRLELRAGQIVAGQRGQPMPVTRSDELGRLMRAINGMAAQLAQREQTLELSRRNYAHQEKMAAVGSLAAGVAHEIGNPIAAIAGVAQSLQEMCTSSHCPNQGSVCHPELILEQTNRIAAITREIADFASPKAAEAELIDLNALVRSTCSFIRYDRRYRHIELTLALDPQLPALHVVADKIVQILMNLLINAADAVEGIAERRPQVTVTTSLVNGRVRLEVRDNGCGMSEDARERAFEPYFTTKAAGKGSGLGLPLCRSLVDGMGGSIGLESVEGEGTAMVVELPPAPR